MLKRSVFLLLFLVLFSSVPFSLAQGGLGDSIDDARDDLEQRREGVEDFFTDGETQTEYLKRRWPEFLGQFPVIGPIIRGVDAVLMFFNPFFKLVLGMEASLSWAFVFAIIIWVALFWALFQPVQVIFGNVWFGLLGAAVIASLVGLSGVIRGAVDVLSTAVSNLWILGLVLLITLVIAYVIVRLGGGLKRVIIKEKIRARKNRAKEDMAVTHARAEVDRRALEDK